MQSPFAYRIQISASTIVLLLIVLCSLTRAEGPVRVAVFKGEGVGPSVNDLLESLDRAGSKQFEVSRITADDIRSGRLSQVDVLVHPGGSGGGQGRAIGNEGRMEVTKFVNGGGGYLGVCAGSYLATNDYSWSLNLIDAKVVDRKHWARGKGTVNLKLSRTGSEFFGHTSEQIEIYYAQGPLLGRREWDDEDVPDYQSLAIYDSEIAQKGAPAGIMAGTSAIVRARYGAGRVFCFSPHPEMTEGREFMIPLAVKWLAKKDDGRDLRE